MRNLSDFKSSVIIRDGDTCTGSNAGVCGGSKGGIYREAVEL